MRDGTRAPRHARRGDRRGSTRGPALRRRWVAVGLVIPALGKERRGKQLSEE